MGSVLYARGHQRLYGHIKVLYSTVLTLSYARVYMLIFAHLFAYEGVHRVIFPFYLILSNPIPSYPVLLERA